MFSRDKSANPLFLCIMAILFCTLQACGLPQEQGGSSGEVGDTSEDGVSAQDETQAYGKTLNINVERLNGSTELSLGNVSLVSLNSDFNEISDGALPPRDVARSEHNNNVQLLLDSDYIEQINHVVKLRFSDDEIYYAPIPHIPDTSNTTAQVTVNIYTHYLVKKLFDQIPDTSNLELHLPCQTGDPVINCETQPRAKQDYLFAINDAASNFNLDLPTDSSITQALDILEQTHEIREYAETSTRELIRDASPFAKGTMREVPNVSGVDEDGNVYSAYPPPWNRAYNSVFLGLSLSNNTSSDGLAEVAYAASNSTIVGNKELANELPAYPKYEVNTALTRLRRESGLFIDIPYERTVLTVNDTSSANKTYNLDRGEPINTYASASSTDSFLSREGNLLEGRILSTARPGDVTDLKDVAWQYEPVFAKLYQANEYEPDPIFSPDEEETEIDFGNEPTWLSGSSFGKAANYAVDNVGTENETLGSQLEDINLFTWELHALQTPSTFTNNLLSGKRFGVISFSQKLNDENDILEIYGETMIWNASNSLFSLEQPSSNTHYRSHTISRNANNSLQTLSSQQNIIENTRTYFSEASEIADSSSEDGIAEVNLGILKLDGGVEAPIGHATESGNHFAFSFNTSDTTSVTDRGTGIIIGMTIDDVSPVFPDSDDTLQAVYQIQGNSVNISGNTNALQNFNGSSLHITNRLPGEAGVDCHATLQLARTYVTHTVDSITNRLSPPTQDDQSDIQSTSCRLTGKEIEIGFGNVFGQDLILKGFVSKSDTDLTTPGNMLTLLWLQENSIGLLFAGKDQILKPDFE